MLIHKSNLYKCVAVRKVGLNNSRLISGFQTLNSDWKQKHIVIVGGGTAGIGVSAMLKNQGLKRITIVEPSDKHYYQPLWTLVGAGLKQASESVRPLRDVIPKGVTLINQAVNAFDPVQNKVTLSNNLEVKYDYLIIAAGLQLNWNSIPGLTSALNQNDSSVVSIYNYEYAQKAWDKFRKCDGGNLLFTFPNTPIKCAGAPLKIMFLVDDMLKQQNLNKATSIQFDTPATAMFGIEKYSTLLEVERVLRHDIQCNYQSELVSVDGTAKKATFRSLVDDSLTERSYDILHVTPPMSAPDFLKQAVHTNLTNTSGYVDVDQYTLQSKTYETVFALGDCSSCPNSKTAAAVIVQSSILVHNLIGVMKGTKQPNAYYNGYASCPLIIARNKVILAEFGYDGVLLETFNKHTGKWPLRYVGQDGQGKLQLRFFYWLVVKLFPYIYWNLWLKGRWYGPNGIFKPKIVESDI